MRSNGFAVVWALAIIAIVALLGAGAVHDSWFAQSQAGARLYEQRAWALAELGLRVGASTLTTTPAPDEVLRELRPTAIPTEHLAIRIRKLNERALPAGFSAGRLVAQEFEIESTGFSARRAQRALVQGMRRVMPVAEAAP
jgi:Tfp pilus assembly protein PilX